MERPIHWNTMAVTRIDIGIAVREIAVVRTLSRKENSTIATTAAASASTFRTLSIDVWMKPAWRNRIWSALTPAGRPAVMSRSASSICRVRRIVSAPGCFSTDTMTAGRPWKPASPRFTLGA
jgi:hypothetical protein